MARWVKATIPTFRPARTSSRLISAPAHVFPEPGGPWSHLFAADLIEGHLDRLARDQQPDGGWAITWEPPGTAATLEWRGMMTLWALRVLRAYGRL